MPLSLVYKIQIFPLYPYNVTIYDTDRPIAIDGSDPLGIYFLVSIGSTPYLCGIQQASLFFATGLRPLSQTLCSLSLARMLTVPIKGITAVCYSGEIHISVWQGKLFLHTLNIRIVTLYMKFKKSPNSYLIDQPTEYLVVYICHGYEKENMTVLKENNQNFPSDTICENM